MIVILIIMMYCCCCFFFCCFCHRCCCCCIFIYCFKCTFSDSVAVVASASTAAFIYTAIADVVSTSFVFVSTRSVANDNNCFNNEDDSNNLHNADNGGNEEYDDNNDSDNNDVNKKYDQNNVNDVNEEYDQNIVNDDNGVNEEYDQNNVIDDNSDNDENTNPKKYNIQQNRIYIENNVYRRKRIFFSARGLSEDRSRLHKVETIKLTKIYQSPIEN